MLEKFFGQKPSMEQEISRIAGFGVVEIDGRTKITVDSRISTQSIRSLLKTLHERKSEFSFYDALYPDKDGSYFAYSQEKNAGPDIWGMTLGNHGWSDGIYTIREENIVLHIENLARKDSPLYIETEKVAFFAHYKHKSDEDNKAMNERLVSTHDTAQAF